MIERNGYRLLTDKEIKSLTQQGCSCSDWSQVYVTEGFDSLRVRNTYFSGRIEIGGNDSRVVDAAGTNKPCGLFNASIHNCTIGEAVRIANVGVHLANYVIGHGVSIENVGLIETRPQATFGNGVEVEPVNEGGGREVVLFGRLNSQFAHLLCLHRYRRRVVERLQAIAQAEAAQLATDRGLIGTGTKIRNVKRMIDVHVGSYAIIDGATSLVNGTILSSPDVPTQIGDDVQAEDFIISEASQVTGGAILSKSFIGQGCRIGKQFSCESSLFFANCEGFHGEACSVFAGPYTVTHHKSTLLIAGLFSFYNAGSGTNQSNHLYKLGPVHEGKLERGCKTGSFSYLMWPCRVGPFSVVLGKHSRTFDTHDFPFSYIKDTPEGRSVMTPGFNLTTVGTVRDGAKWPARDRRKSLVKRDRISFDVLSPLTVGRMMIGMARMKQLHETTDRSINTVTISGVDVKRVLLRTGQKSYQSAVHAYLLEKVLVRVERAIETGVASWSAAFAAESDSVFSEQWVDIGGQIMSHGRLDELCAAIEEGSIADIDAFYAELDKIEAAYVEDEWAWVRWAYSQVFEADLDDVTASDLVSLADDLVTARGRFINVVLNDAAKEFGEVIHMGFGQDGSAEDEDADFTAVRGTLESNPFVEQMKADLAELEGRVGRFKEAIQSNPL